MKSRGSGSEMFLMELLLGIMIFAIAAAICMQVFVTAHRIADDSNNLNRAVVAAQNGAECFKATNGDLAETAELLGGASVDGDTLSMRFDYEWKPYGESGFGFLLKIVRVSNQDGLVEGALSVSDASGNPIFEIPVAVAEVRP
jgi:hypothetical protein